MCNHGLREVSAFQANGVTLYTCSTAQLPQTSDKILDDMLDYAGVALTPFLNAGVAGIILVWFMLRLERILNRFDESVQLMTRAIIRLLERHDADMASDLSKVLSQANDEVATLRRVAARMRYNATHGANDMSLRL